MARTVIIVFAASESRCRRRDPGMRARRAAACRRTSLLRSSSAASRKGSSAIERFSTERFQEPLAVVGAVALPCRFDERERPGRILPSHGCQDREPLRTLAGLPYLVGIGRDFRRGHRLLPVRVQRREPLAATAERGKDRLGAARLPGPPVQQQRRSRTVDAHSVRQRELRPFLDERRIGIAEEPDQRGDRALAGGTGRSSRGGSGSRPECICGRHPARACIPNLAASVRSVSAERWSPPVRSVPIVTAAPSARSRSCGDGMPLTPPTSARGRGIQPAIR